MPREVEVMPLVQALAAMKMRCDQMGRTADQSRLAQLLVSSCQTFEIGPDSFVRKDEVRGFILNFQKAVLQKDSSWLLQKRGLCREMVDMEEFLESHEYMNQAGYVRPAIKKKLIELFETPGFVEGVLTGAIGIGKNYFADMALARMVYELSCYHNPQLEHDLAPGSSIIFIVQSKTLTLAKKVAFEQFAERLKLSPYFQKVFPFDPQVKSELRFPKQVTVMPVGGTDTSALGMNVYGGLIDEMNFMDRVTDSTYTRYTGEEEYDQAERLYSTIIRRMKSRFQQKGRLPGKLLLVSSRSYPGDFTDRKMDEAVKDRSIFVMNYAQWEALPEDRFSGEKFLVEVGDESKQSRIVLERSEAKDPDDVIEVPTEYRAEFERDIDAALRDLGGIATGTRSPFIPYKELIVSSYEKFNEVTGKRQLFLYDEIVPQEMFPPEEEGRHDFWRLVDREYIEQLVLDRTVPFAVHLDVGLGQNDAAGLAIGHIAGYVLLPSTKFFNEKTQEFTEIRDIRAPIYQIDGVLRSVARPGEEVDLEVLRDVLLFLRGELNVRWATFDSYQYAMLVSACRKARMRSGVLSVDTSIAPYTELKLAIKDERLLQPQHVVLQEELRTVEKDKKRMKIDHPPSGSKDCSDAVAGVVYMLMSKEASYGRPHGRRRRRTETVAEEHKGVRRVRIGSRPTGRRTVRKRLR